MGTYLVGVGATRNEHEGIEEGEGSVGTGKRYGLVANHAIIRVQVKGWEKWHAHRRSLSSREVKTRGVEQPKVSITVDKSTGSRVCSWWGMFSLVTNSRR